MRVFTLVVASGAAVLLSSGVWNVSSALAQDGKQAKMVFQKAGPLPPGKDAKAFEVATIKPNTSGNGKAMFAGRPRGLDLTNYSAKMLIKMAFGNLADERIAGGPAWDFELTWTPDVVATPGAAAAAEAGGPLIFTALEEQLGLRLQSGRAPLEVLVIDKLEKPSAN